MSAQNMFSQEEQESDHEESDVDLDDVLAGAKRPRVSGLPKKELKTSTKIVFCGDHNCQR